MELLQIIDGEHTGAANVNHEDQGTVGAVKSFGFTDFYEFDSSVHRKYQS